MTLLPTTDGKLWVGTRGGLGLYTGGHFRTFTTADGLASDSIRSVYEYDDGVVWIGSYDGGFTRLKDGRFTIYTMRDGLSSNEQGIEITWPPTNMEWGVREMHIRHLDGHVFRISRGIEET